MDAVNGEILHAFRLVLHKLEGFYNCFLTHSFECHIECQILVCWLKKVDCVHKKNVLAY